MWYVLTGEKFKAEWDGKWLSSPEGKLPGWFVRLDVKCGETGFHGNKLVLERKWGQMMKNDRNI